MLKNNSVIIIYGKDIQKQTFKKFQIDNLVSQNINIISIDASMIFYGDTFISYETSEIEFDRLNDFKVSSFKELKKVLEKYATEKNQLIFFDLPQRFECLFQFNYLKKKFSFCHFCLLSVSNASALNTYLWNSLTNIKKSAKRMIKKIIFFLIKYCIKNVDYVFYSGTENLKNILVGPNTNKISIIHPDLNNYKKLPKSYSEKYLLYLDSGFFNTLDNDIFDIKSSIIDLYIKELCDFLKHAGSKLNLKPIIAAHPKSTLFRDQEGHIQGIKFVKNKTLNLSISSSVVCSDFPTNSFCMPLFLRKPTFFFFFHSLFNDFKGSDWRYIGFIEFESLFRKEFFDPSKNDFESIIKDQTNNFFGYDEYVRKYLLADHQVNSKEFSSQLISNFFND